MTILELQNNQPEFKTPIWDYLAALVDEERVQDGRAAMQQWGRRSPPPRPATGSTAT